MRIIPYIGGIILAVALALAMAEPVPVNPKAIRCVWTPGDYSNFVVVSATNLNEPVNQWPVYLVTTETNFPFDANEPQRFFALYGTNSDGDSAWAGSQPGGNL